MLRFKIVLIIIFIALLGIIFNNYFSELWMRYALRNEHIVVSLTTTPYRMHQSKAVIDFIIAETRKTPIHAIYFNIPYIFKRDKLEYKIPNWLQNNSKITVLRTNDYGPATKLLGALEQADIPQNAIIITLDDDVIYPKNIILYLAYRAHNNPDAAIGISGMNPHYDNHHQIVTIGPGVGLKPDFNNNATVAILEGFGGIAYRRKFFDNKIFEILNAPRECINSDDVYLSFYLAQHNIERKVLRETNMSLDYIVWDQLVGFNVDALHKLSPTPAERHKICIAYLQQKYPDVKF